MQSAVVLLFFGNGESTGIGYSSFKSASGGSQDKLKYNR